MDLKELNASQLVLLTLLVSFVTSIATGVVTISLMEQAPPTVAQTVNRVVERTVERIVPAAQEASVVVPTVTEKTVIVKEADYIAAAVERITPSIVRLFTVGTDEEGGEIDVFLGLGVVISDSGTILTDAAAWPASGTVIVERPDGSRVPAYLQTKYEDSGVLLLDGATSTPEGDISWRAANVSTDEVKLGAPVVSIAGRTGIRVGNGIVSAFPASESFGFIDTNVPQGAIVFGSVVLDTEGRVIGLSTAVSRAQAETTFLATRSMPMYNQAETEAPVE